METVLLYRHLDHEPSLSLLEKEYCKAWKRLLYPVEWTSQSCVAEWKEGVIFWKRWILLDWEQEIYHWNIDVAYVPWLAFDKTWRRLGHGWWWYDRLFADHPESVKIWVCYQEQLLPEWKIPRDEWDVSMDEMIIL